MKCKFQIGQKVVSIDDDSGCWCSCTADEECESAQSGQVYTTRDIVVRWDFNGEVFLQFDEIPNTEFHHVHFRPLNERPQQTDISVFRRLLKTRKLEDA
jgi:hypothetical protein